MSAPKRDGWPTRREPTNYRRARRAGRTRLEALVYVLTHGWRPNR